MKTVKLILLISILIIISACKHDPEMDHDGYHSDSDSEHSEPHYVDANNNDINDYYEEDTHSGDGHAFIDEDSDGICDRSQDGSSFWHGPGN